MYDHYLDHIETLTLSGVQIFPHIGSAAFGEEQPPGIPKPEKRLPIRCLKIPSVCGYLQARHRIRCMDDLW
jgi:hypothetical protein